MAKHVDCILNAKIKKRNIQESIVYLGKHDKNYDLKSVVVVVVFLL